MDCLPTEILVHICKFVEWSDLATLAATSIQFRDLIFSEKLMSRIRNESTHCTVLKHQRKAITCPYNKAHVISCANMQWHLIECRKDSAMQNILIDCPFRYLHAIPIMELQYHVTTCSLRFDTLTKLKQYFRFNYFNCIHGPQLMQISENDNSIHVSSSEVTFTLKTRDGKIVLKRITNKFVP
jgi:hypothetical protein